MLINDIFKKYKSNNEIFEFIPINGINYLSPISNLVRKQIEDECLKSDFFIEALLQSRKDKWFVFQLLSMVDNFPHKFFENILLTLLSAEGFFHIGNFHLHRIYGFLLVENWFQEEFNNTYSHFDKFNLLNIWRNNKYGDLVDIVGDKIILESKASYSWEESKYVNTGEIIKDSKYELDLNLIMQKRYNLILNFILDYNFRFDIMVSALGILPKFQEFNDDNKELLKEINKKLKVTQNHKFDFWLKSYDV